MNKKITIIASVVLGLILILGFLIFVATIQESPVELNKVSVVTSFYPLYFFADQIGGDRTTVINITPFGAEPHDYEPTGQDFGRVEDSKLLVLLGSGFEKWAENVKGNIDTKGVVIITVGDDIITKQEDTFDPHVWLDPLLAKEMAIKIARALIEVDPGNKSYYEANITTLKEKLDDLDKEYKEGLKNCQQKNIVTSHNAFEYLASAYGLRQVPISGLSPDAEPSPQQLVDIVKFAKTNMVKYIFFESLVSPKLSQTIATEVGAETLVLNPLEGLTDKEITEGENYFTKMQQNLGNLKIALDCK